MFNLVVFGAVLIFYSPKIFVIFAIGSILYILWIVYFLKRRKELDYKRFSQLSQEQSTVIELINGMQEIKMYNAEKQKRWKWEFVQARLFKVSIHSLSLEQTQGVGSSVINELKNIIITFTSALLVIEGSITLGMMLSIQYIIGQLNGPIGQMVGFIRSYQDAKISMERLSEIHDKDDEEDSDKQLLTHINPYEAITLSNISYRYLGSDEYIIKNLNLVIPPKKITAIVGASGSGKTTLMKLLLKFYKPQKGKIHYGEHYLESFSHKVWRDHCGAVMQEGYVFNDTIAYNIAIGQDIIDQELLIQATKIANIYDFIQSLPLGFNTKIGNEGVGMSSGQKQRLFIARAVYKNPELLCFDEATSALDAKNERIIMENLNNFFEDKTVVIIAHRLSTVKNAHQIVVIDEGKIMESGNHQELLDLKGSYYNLVKNQLELEKLKTDMSKKEEHINLNLRSEEVQEILSNPPGWIVRWGITLIFAIILIALVLSMIIRYPDFITAKVIVTTEQPTERIVARYSGPLEEIYVKNGDVVTAGQKLAVIRNTGNTSDIFHLGKILDTIQYDPMEFTFPIGEVSRFLLGDIGAAYVNFEKSYVDFNLLKDLQPYNNLIAENRNSLREFRKRLKDQIEQKYLLDQEMQLEKTDFERYKVLLQKDVISQQEFDQKKTNFLKMKKNISSMAISISQMREAIASASHTLTNSQINQQEDITRFTANLTQSYNVLQKAFRDWKYAYLLTSSIEGKVSFQEFWGANQFVESGETIFTILPTDTDRLVGKMILPSLNAGKIEVGQKVLIKLDNLPYQQYGMLLGEVKAISISPNKNDNYFVYISLPQGTKTSYNQTLSFTQELLGNAEIITENLSVAERIFYKFKDVLNINNDCKNERFNQ